MNQYLEAENADSYYILVECEATDTVIYGLSTSFCFSAKTLFLKII